MTRECQAQVDSQGRLYIPKSTRKALDIDGNSATVNLQVEVIETHE